MGRCTGRRCPAQVGYDVANCNQFDCIYRTEINTNYDRIKSMNVEEMAEFLCKISGKNEKEIIGTFVCNYKEYYEQWLLQEVSEDDR